MIILAVIGVIILVFAALLNVPVTAHIRYYGRKLDVSVKYFGIGIFPKKARKKRTKKRETSKPPPEAEDEEEIFEDIAQLGFEEKQRNSEISENDDEGGISEDELYDALENDRENSDEGTGNLTEAFRENSEGNGEKKNFRKEKGQGKNKK